MHTLSPRPLIDLTVVDADLIPSDNPHIQSIHVWYEDETVPQAEKPMSQIKMCGHSLLNYLRNVAGQSYDTVESFWYGTHPRSRDKVVEECLEFQANSRLI